MGAPPCLEPPPTPQVPSQRRAYLCAVWGHIEDKKGPLLRPGRLDASPNSVLSHIEVMRGLLLFRELDRNGWKENGGAVRFRLSLPRPVCLSVHPSFTEPFPWARALQTVRVNKQKISPGGAPKLVGERNETSSNSAALGVNTKILNRGHRPCVTLATSAASSHTILLPPHHMLGPQASSVPPEARASHMLLSLPETSTLVPLPILQVFRSLPQ